MNVIRHILGLCCSLLFFIQVAAQQLQLSDSITASWEELFIGHDCPIERIKEVYIHNQRMIERLASPENKASMQRLNDDFLVWKAGTHWLFHRGEVKNPEEVYALLPDSGIGHIGAVDKLPVKPDIWVDYYYLLKAMQQGASFDEARDGIGFSTSFPLRELNGYDRIKLEGVFSTDNDLLHQAFLQKLGMVFRNWGWTEQLAAVRPLIRKNVKESPLKDEIESLYLAYEKLKKGMPAPDFRMLDENGKEYHLSDFSGKKVVVDVWATWCCSCLEKMPDFMQLRELYKDRKDIVFISLSIDREEHKDKWKKALVEHRMSSILNFIAGRKESDFQENYRIEGVPRYLVIDEQGNIVTAFGGMGCGF